MFKRKKKEIDDFEVECLSYMDTLYNTALKLTKNNSSAEELVQETYLKAFKYKKSFNRGTNLKAWVFRILTNTFINNYRHLQNEYKYLERTAVEPLYDQVLGEYARSYVANPEEHLFNKFFTVELEEALNDLPPDFKIAVTLSDIEEFSYKEISEILDKPIGTVMSRLHRGRKMLQQRLVDFAAAEGLSTDGIFQKKNKTAKTAQGLSAEEKTADVISLNIKKVN
ncbi:MAG: sigma-70 family RNA polymerase sigma factor [Deltaproteobacteria bacterium]|nr:sigma-70 family RNA polymerase sigma factor [Deltaproteobacteria bacterium]